MKLAWQIVKKDARRLRWPLALWLTLVAADLALGVSLVSGTERMQEDLRSIMLWHDALVGLQALLGCMIAAQLVHEDPVSDARAFWPTRPISGLRLFRAKLLGLVTLLWLPPLALLIPWWISSGFGLGNMAWAALATIFWQAVITLPAMALASVTPTLSRFLFWGFVSASALVALIFTGDHGHHLQDTWDAMRGSYAYSFLRSVGREDIDIQDQEIRFLTIGLAMVLTGLLATIYHYRTGRIRPAIGILSCAVAVGQLGVWLSPWNLATVITLTFIPERWPDNPNNILASMLVAQYSRTPPRGDQMEGFDVKLADTVTATKGNEDPLATYSIPIRIDKIPPDESVEQLRILVDVNPGVNLPALSPGSKRPIRPTYAPELVLWPPLSVYLGGASTPIDDSLDFLVFQGAPLDQRLPNTIKVQLKLAVARQAPLAELPLKVGAHDPHAPGRLKILNWRIPEKYSSAWTGGLNSWPTVTIAQRKPGGNLIDRVARVGLPTSLPELEYLLINRTGSRPIGIQGYFSTAPFRNPLNGERAIHRLQIGGVTIEVHQINFVNSLSRASLAVLGPAEKILGPWLAAPPDAKWLAGASLLQVKKTYLGMIEREATVANVNVNDLTKVSTPSSTP